MPAQAIEQQGGVLIDDQPSQFAIRHAALLLLRTLRRRAPSGQWATTVQRAAAHQTTVTNAPLANGLAPGRGRGVDKQPLQLAHGRPQRLQPGPLLVCLFRLRRLLDQRRNAAERHGLPLRAAKRALLDPRLTHVGAQAGLRMPTIPRRAVGQHHIGPSGRFGALCGGLTLIGARKLHHLALRQRSVLRQRKACAGCTRFVDQEHHSRLSHARNLFRVGFLIVGSDLRGVIERVQSRSQAQASPADVLRRLRPPIRGHDAQLLAARQMGVVIGRPIQLRHQPGHRAAQQIPIPLREHAAQRQIGQIPNPLPGIALRTAQIGQLGQKDHALNAQLRRRAQRSQHLQKASHHAQTGNPFAALDAPHMGAQATETVLRCLKGRRRLFIATANAPCCALSAVNSHCQSSWDLLRMPWVFARCDVAQYSMPFCLDQGAGGRWR
ncbi:hypothetical protein MAIT1_01037 [Magnetofaba australis IT-1]|uniref:Uncharacterized protein n=1 Tax=Magnetofaba australis IT-1 TaxID=1434232 RepID=A0A1Y2K4N1_9PROT|nr:hypothetical protein MAIT1_01037 [Magnetofaba australis IT-1]